MTKLRNSVGDRIRDIRKAKGLTQQQLAELSNLDDAYIGSVERGERNFSIDSLEKIIDALKVHPSEFFQSYDKTNKVEAAQREAVDEYTVAMQGLSVEEIERMKRIVREVRGAFK
ncbi:helix-turn-helix domain-containing protein [Paenibacillus tepidiphilus]|uniref:helix-turn-helix domain-containing protein n=1 Tax=Paenibacillus tepidiphilus TaxID=2608683 RepID=UPI00123BAE9C|nr:helix-turn-helix transcriptional regulator [Paenibacillus tepidiphilus]